MSKNWIMLAALVFLGAAGTLQAHPLDAPDIVYIDGLPCNSACQTYMAWTRRKTSSAARHSAPVEAAPLEIAPVEPPKVRPASQRPALRSAHGAARTTTAAHRDVSKPAAARVAKQAVPASPAGIVIPKPAGEAAINPEPAPAIVATLPPAAAPAVSRSTTLKEQVAAATALAEQVTAASTPAAPQREAVDAEASSSVSAAAPGEAESATSAATSRDNRVALLMTLPEIRSLSDLTGKDVAIEDQQSSAGTSIRAAIASAGAAEVRLNEGTTKAIDRLVGGEVQAAVLTLVSPEAAAWFPDVPGYRIFRIPLAPG